MSLNCVMTLCLIAAKAVNLRVHDPASECLGLVLPLCDCRLSGSVSSTAMLMARWNSEPEKKGKRLHAPPCPLEPQRSALAVDGRLRRPGCRGAGSYLGPAWAQPSPGPAQPVVIPADRAARCACAPCEKREPHQVRRNTRSSAGTRIGPANRSRGKARARYPKPGQGLGP